MKVNYAPIYTPITRHLHGMLWKPEGNYSKVGVVILHSDENYLNFTGGKNLAARGFLTLCANVEHPDDPLEKKLPSVSAAIQLLKQQPGIEKVVIFGHSGGATLMSCYQAVAENGPEVFRDPHRIVPMGEVPDLIAADGVMLIDSNFGNGVMTLISLEPGIQDESAGANYDRRYDGSLPENGFRPDGSTHYTEAFKTEFFAVQAGRQQKLIASALERLKAIERHQGKFWDDEPMLIPGGNQIAPCNKLINEDLSLLAHTKGTYDLLHGDGTVSHQVIPSVRKAKGGKNPTPFFGMAASIVTVRSYLSSKCVRTTEDFRICEDGITGIDYDSSFCCTPGNVKHIHAPLLIMGMTAGYEFMASEIIWQNAASLDKTIAFVEGAAHMLVTDHNAEQFPGQFGDAAGVLFDYIAAWLNRTL